MLSQINLEKAAKAAGIAPFDYILRYLELKNQQFMIDTLGTETIMELQNDEPEKLFP